MQGQELNANVAGHAMRLPVFSLSPSGPAETHLQPQVIAVTETIVKAYNWKCTQVRDQHRKYLAFRNGPTPPDKLDKKEGTLPLFLVMPPAIAVIKTLPFFMQ